MAGSIIEVDTTQLARDKNAVQERINQVRTSLKSIYTDVAELDAMWDGVANQVFKAQFDADREEFEAMCTMYEELVDKLEIARTEYEKCEAQVNAAIAAIKI